MVDKCTYGRVRVIKRISLGAPPEHHSNQYIMKQDIGTRWHLHVMDVIIVKPHDKRVYQCRLNELQLPHIISLMAQANHCEDSLFCTTHISFIQQDVFSIWDKTISYVIHGMKGWTTTSYQQRDSIICFDIVKLTTWSCDLN